MVSHLHRVFYDEFKQQYFLDKPEVSLHSILGIFCKSSLDYCILLD